MLQTHNALGSGNAMEDFILIPQTEQMITDSNDSDLESSNGNWAINNDTETLEDWADDQGQNTSGGLKVTCTTTTAAEGLKLANQYFGDLIVGETYEVKMDLKSSSTSNMNTNYVIGLGGVISSVFNISTKHATYTEYITVTDADEDLTILNVNNVASHFFVDNISLKKVSHNNTKLYLHAPEVCGIKFMATAPTSSGYIGNDSLRVNAGFHVFNIPNGANFFGIKGMSTDDQIYYAYIGVG
jgi:hypothetical protein